MVEYVHENQSDKAPEAPHPQMAIRLFHLFVLAQWRILVINPYDGTSAIGAFLLLGPTHRLTHHANGRSTSIDLCEDSSAPLALLVFPHYRNPSIQDRTYAFSELRTMLSRAHALPSSPCQVADNTRKPESASLRQ